LLNPLSADDGLQLECGPLWYLHRTYQAHDIRLPDHTRPELLAKA
jgi:hypothetical protein